MRVARTRSNRHTSTNAPGLMAIAIAAIATASSSTVVKKRILTNRRLLHVVDTGIPDGIKVDARGRLFVGCGDGVHVLSRDGELLGKIKLPGKDPAANLAFGKLNQCQAPRHRCDGSVHTQARASIGRRSTSSTRRP